MNYQETINYLYEAAPLFQQVGGAAYKEGLSTTQKLDEHFNHPHRQFRSIHVAGTNGKGSCAHTIAAILQHKGLKVGLYTSPHLIDFRERIRINGQMIPEQYVIDFVENERSYFEPLHPSFFELTTALAFKYFADNKVDIAVIEVGLGGRLDCTNIITPILSIITNISFDHTQFLGNTLAEIAAEKAGIIKSNVPVVIGESHPETKTTFQHQADLTNSPILFAQEQQEVLSSETTEDNMRLYKTVHWGNILGELTGECQVKNTNTILNAINLIRPIFNLTAEDVAYGFKYVCKSTGLQGRWQILQNNPQIICDTGHNVGGWTYLAKQLDDIAKKVHKLHIVFGMATDKNVDAVIAHLPKNATYYWTQASVRRAMKAETVNEIGIKNELHGAFYPNVEEAYNEAVKCADKNDCIYIGGSSFIVADLLTYLQKANDISGHSA